jgi:hypothetical protein
VTYYKLTDLENEGTVVRARGRSQQKYIKDKGWIESGVMIKYFNTDSPYYDSYTEISEEEANNIIAAM